MNNNNNQELNNQRSLNNESNNQGSPNNSQVYNGVNNNGDKLFSEVNSNNSSKLDKIKKSKYKAVIFNGNTIGRIEPIKLNDNKFKVSVLGRTYNIKTDDVMTIKIKRLFKNEYYLLYHINSPDPLHLTNKGVKPKHLTADEYNSILESKVIQDINKNVKLPDLNYKAIAIGVIAVLVGVGIFMSQGGI